MDNNRTILAVVLIVLLWSAYSLFFAPQQPIQQPAAVEQKLEKTTTPVEQPVVAETTDSSPALETNAAESTVSVSSDFYNI